MVTLWGSVHRVKSENFFHPVSLRTDSLTLRLKGLTEENRIAYPAVIKALFRLKTGFYYSICVRITTHKLKHQQHKHKQKKNEHVSSSYTYSYVMLCCIYFIFR